LIERFKFFSQTVKDITQKVYNLNDGAFLEGAIPLNVLDINIKKFSQKDSTKIKQEIIESLNSISCSKFKDEDRKFIKHQILEAKKVMKKLSMHKKKRYISIQVYFDSLSVLLSQIASIGVKSSSYLSLIYFLYIKVVSPYIFELLNTKELDKPMEHIKKIDSILVRQLEKICMKFIKSLEGYIK